MIVSNCKTLHATLHNNGMLVRNAFIINIARCVSVGGLVSYRAFVFADRATAILPRQAAFVQGGTEPTSERALDSLLATTCEALHVLGVQNNILLRAGQEDVRTLPTTGGALLFPRVQATGTGDAADAVTGGTSTSRGDVAPTTAPSATMS